MLSARLSFVCRDDGSKSAGVVPNNAVRLPRSGCVARAAMMVRRVVLSIYHVVIGRL